MAKNSKKCLKMVKSGQKWPKLVKNVQKWLKFFTKKPKTSKKVLKYLLGFKGPMGFNVLNPEHENAVLYHPSVICH